MLCARVIVFAFGLNLYGLMYHFHGSTMLSNCVTVIALICGAYGWEEWSLRHKNPNLTPFLATK